MGFYKFLLYPNNEDVFVLYELDNNILKYILNNLNDAISLSYPICKFYIDHIYLVFDNGIIDIDKSDTKTIGYEYINIELLEALTYEHFNLNNQYMELNDIVLQKISLKAYALIALNIFFNHDIKLVAIGLVLLSIDLGIASTPFKQNIIKRNSIFSFTPESFKSLSIENQIRIFNLCKNKKNFILTGSTGIGKTKIIPKLIFLYHFYFDGFEINWNNFGLAHKKNIQYSEVLLVLPRKVLITKVGKDLYESLGFNSLDKSPVHYLFQRSKNQKNVFNNKYRSFKTTICISIDRLAFSRITTSAFVIVDEVHENNIFSDIFITVAKNKKKPICLITATPDDQLKEIKEYFNNIIHVNIQGPTRFKINTIQEKTLTRSDIINGDDNLVKIIKQFAKPRLCILFFLARVAEIKLLKTFLINQFKNDNIKIFVVYREVLNEDPTLIETIEKTKNPSVVLATNILESSITIKNVNIVIDAGTFFTFRFFTNITLNITKSMMLQRMGRVGRVSDGTYIKLYNNLSNYKKIDNNFLFLYIIFNFAFNIDLKNFFSKPKDMSRVDKTLYYIKNVMSLDINKNIGKIYNILIKENCNIFEYVNVYLYGTLYQKEHLRLIDTQEMIDAMPIIKSNIKNYLEIAKLINIPLIRYKKYFLLKNNFEKAPSFLCTLIDTNFYKEPYLLTQSICIK